MRLLLYFLTIVQFSSCAVDRIESLHSFMELMLEPLPTPSPSASTTDTEPSTTSVMNPTSESSTNPKSLSTLHAPTSTRTYPVFSSSCIPTMQSNIYLSVEIINSPLMDKYRQKIFDFAEIFRAGFTIPNLPSGTKQLDKNYPNQTLLNGWDCYDTTCTINAGFCTGYYDIFLKNTQTKQAKSQVPDYNRTMTYIDFYLSESAPCSRYDDKETFKIVVWLWINDLKDAEPFAKNIAQTPYFHIFLPFDFDIDKRFLLYNNSFVGQLLAHNNAMLPGLTAEDMYINHSKVVDPQTTAEELVEMVWIMICRLRELASLPSSPTPTKPPKSQTPLPQDELSFCMATLQSNIYLSVEINNSTEMKWNRERIYDFGSYFRTGFTIPQLDSGTKELQNDYPHQTLLNGWNCCDNTCTTNTGFCTGYYDTFLKNTQTKAAREPVPDYNRSMTYIDYFTSESAPCSRYDDMKTLKIVVWLWINDFTAAKPWAKILTNTPYFHIFVPFGFDINPQMPEFKYSFVGQLLAHNNKMLPGLSYKDMFIDRSIVTNPAIKSTTLVEIVWGMICRVSRMSYR